jgi:hypothetical protein
VEAVLTTLIVPLSVQQVESCSTISGISSVDDDRSGGIIHTKFSAEVVILRILLSLSVVIVLVSFDAVVVVLQLGSSIVAVLRFE